MSNSRIKFSVSFLVYSIYNIILIYKCIVVTVIYRLGTTVLQQNNYNKPLSLFEISSSHGGEYEVQICLLSCTAV
jgi:hypothetical protein